MNNKKRNKIDGIVAIALFILIVVAYYILQRYFTDRREIYMRNLTNIGLVNIPMCDNVEIISTEGAFPADGKTYIIYYFNKESAQRILGEIESSTVWKPLEQEDYFRIENRMKKVKNGYGYYESLDHTQEIYDRFNPVENERIGGTWLREFEIGVFDSDNYILYYYRWTL